MDIQAFLPITIPQFLSLKARSRTSSSAIPPSTFAASTPSPFLLVDVLPVIADAICFLGLRLHGFCTASSAFAASATSASFYFSSSTSASCSLLVFLTWL
ncbi:uncharacterized protein DS421_17g590440 [Arachis hypogaea]|nr:uncharacterized protein DS421_17g590440 [Arachis hypogaea]